MHQLAEVLRDQTERELPSDNINCPEEAPSDAVHDTESEIIGPSVNSRTEQALFTEEDIALLRSVFRRTIHRGPIWQEIVRTTLEKEYYWRFSAP